MLFFGPNNRCRQNIMPITSCDDCGLRVRIASSECCTQVCRRVSYEVTVTNNCDVTARNVILRINVPQVLCVDCSTIVVNGNSNPNLNLECIELGDLEVGQTVTINYQATVMECQRYVRTSAIATCELCCCCQKSHLAFSSNVNVVQVCCCCCGCNNTTTAN